jgi:hypothetical protein
VCIRLLCVALIPGRVALLALTFLYLCGLLMGDYWFVWGLDRWHTVFVVMLYVL